MALKVETRAIFPKRRKNFKIDNDIIVKNQGVIDTAFFRLNQLSSWNGATFITRNHKERLVSEPLELNFCLI